MKTPRTTTKPAPAGLEPRSVTWAIAFLKPRTDVGPSCASIPARMAVAFCPLAQKTRLETEAGNRLVFGATYRCGTSRISRLPSHSIAVFDCKPGRSTPRPTRASRPAPPAATGSGARPVPSRPRVVQRAPPSAIVCASGEARPPSAANGSTSWHPGPDQPPDRAARPVPRNPQAAHRDRRACRRDAAVSSTSRPPPPPRLCASRRPASAG